MRPNRCIRHLSFRVFANRTPQEIATVDHLEYTRDDFTTTLKRKHKELHFRDRTGHNYSFKDAVTESPNDKLVFHKSTDAADDVQVAYGTVMPFKHPFDGYLVVSASFRAPDDPVILIGAYASLLACQIKDKEHDEWKQEMIGQVVGALTEAVLGAMVA